MEKQQILQQSLIDEANKRDNMNPMGAKTSFLTRKRKSSCGEQDKGGNHGHGNAQKYTQNLLNQFALDVQRSIIYE